jgi:hypothetical protein
MKHMSNKRIVFFAGVVVSLVVPWNQWKHMDNQPLKLLGPAARPVGPWHWAPTPGKRSQEHVLLCLGSGKKHEKTVWV